LNDVLKKFAKCIHSQLALKAEFFGNLLLRFVVKTKGGKRSVVWQAFVEVALKGQAS
jgi:hypothetical protein